MRIKVRLKPRASKNDVVGIVSDELKVHVSAPPADNKANQACIKVLASFFKVPKSAITLVSGRKSRDKVFDIPGLDEELFQKKISELKK